MDFKKHKFTFYSKGFPDRIIRFLVKSKGFSFGSDLLFIEKSMKISSSHSAWIEMGVDPSIIGSLILNIKIFRDGNVFIVNNSDESKIISFSSEDKLLLRLLLTSIGVKSPDLESDIFSLDLFFRDKKDVVNVGYNLYLSEAKKIASEINSGNHYENITYQILNKLDQITYVSIPEKGRHRWKGGSLSLREDFLSSKFKKSRCRCGDTPRISFSPIFGFLTQCLNAACSEKSTSESARESFLGLSRH